VIYTAKGDYDRALADLSRAIDLDPKLAFAFAERAHAYTNKGDPERAVADASRAIELDPKSSSSWRARGRAYSAKGDYDRAVADYSQAIKANPTDAHAVGDRGFAYVKKGDAERAMADYMRAIELDPKFMRPYNNRGLLYLQRGDYDRAIADYSHYIETDQKWYGAYVNRGIAYLKTGKLDLARADIEKALQLKPGLEKSKAALKELEQAEAAAKAPSPAQRHQAAVESAKPAVDAPAKTVAPLGKRVALVIGNSDYDNIPRLDNPLNDAKLVAATLRDLGFTLVGGEAQTNLDKANFDAVVQKFGAELQGADVGLFYYAGHGVRVRGANYLVPVSANPTREVDVDFQMVDANLVLRQMEAAGTRLNLVMLDACRNNPFGKRGLRGSGGGLAQMQAPEGTLISFATQPGNVAQDGSDGHSPYTKALAEVLTTPGLEIFQTFNRVGLEVKRATGGSQQPWLSSSPIEGVFYFRPVP